MKNSLLLFTAIFILNISFAQKHPDFTIIDQVKTTSVKDQWRTGTCWSYTTTSFIETEALRLGKNETDLSEMYFVYYAYINKAYDFLRYYGKANFSEGGQAHDVTNVVKKFGLVPETVYSGINYEADKHNHEKFAKDLTAIVENAVKEKEKNVSTWYADFKNMLDSIMGEVPQSFTYKGNEFTPNSFNKSEIGFLPEDYIEFTSFTHHPFYDYVDLEVPDNWSHDRYYNLPIDELTEVMNYALKNGYSVAWDGDVSEVGFDHKTGKSNLSEEDLKKIKEIGCQDYRQETFDDFTSTDDHLMHITGIAKEKDGGLYYLTKNSWGIYNKYGGYLYMSEDYIKIKTIAFMVHKDAVPETIALKLGLK